MGQTKKKKRAKQQYNPAEEIPENLRNFIDSVSIKQDENVVALKKGLENLERHIQNIKKFGLELRDDIVFTLSKLRWETLIKNNSDLVADRPQEGDLVYFPTTNAFFEIQFVEHEQPFYQQSALPTYKLSCTRFEYSSERLDTGIATIDSVETSLSTDTMQFQFSLENETGSFVLESSVGAIDYLINEDFTMATQATNDQGQAFETAAGTNTSSTADDILDFSERNPFGEVDEY